MLSNQEISNDPAIFQDHRHLQPHLLHHSSILSTASSSASSSASTSHLSCQNHSISSSSPSQESREDQQVKIAIAASQVEFDLHQKFLKSLESHQIHSAYRQSKFDEIFKNLNHKISLIQLNQDDHHKNWFSSSSSSSPASSITPSIPYRPPTRHQALHLDPKLVSASSSNRPIIKSSQTETSINHNSNLIQSTSASFPLIKSSSLNNSSHSQSNLKSLHKPPDLPPKPISLSSTRPLPPVPNRNPSISSPSSTTSEPYFKSNHSNSTLNTTINSIKFPSPTHFRNPFPEQDSPDVLSNNLTCLDSNDPFFQFSFQSHRESTSTIESKTTSDGIEEEEEKQINQHIQNAITRAHDENKDLIINPNNSHHDQEPLTFNINPYPPSSLLKGIKYGKLTQVDQNIELNGQFPDTLILSQYSKNEFGQIHNLNKSTSSLPDGYTKNLNPLFAIEALSWNQLLAYLMWHGSSRIEAGVLDIAEAEELQTGGWELELHVSFSEVFNQVKVRLILELVRSGKRSKLKKKLYTKTEELKKQTRHYSLYSRSSIEHQIKSSSHVIHLPGPHLKLPIRLSALACLLHEIHMVARMSTCWSPTSSIPNPFRLHSKKSSPSTLKHHGNSKKARSNAEESEESEDKDSPKNSEILKELAKSILNNSKLLGEQLVGGGEGENSCGEYELIDYLESAENGTEKRKRLKLKKGKKWFTRKKIELIKNSHHHSQSIQFDLNEEIEDDQNTELEDEDKDLDNEIKVDGNGLPLPDGATLIQPWDSDWV
ncbi:hypothetical protein O181_039455 [Austropuccinia psidii MF-1]|uniref:Uncharacterized protein n=1 Tax=Austropuccinia psidii MF-1 TaxID=1389203 RepID=A0A9Q3DBK7_9BASI|nr:hypothetical protein [Austropuccinia psidii MF-1]